MYACRSVEEVDPNYRLTPAYNGATVVQVLGLWKFAASEGIPPTPLTAPQFRLFVDRTNLSRSGVPKVHFSRSQFLWSVGEMPVDALPPLQLTLRL